MLDRNRNRGLQVEAAVGPIMVVVGSEFPEDGQEMSLVDHNEMVKALGSNGPHGSLADRVRLRRP